VKAGRKRRDSRNEGRRQQDRDKDGGDIPEHMNSQQLQFGLVYLRPAGNRNKRCLFS